MHQIYRTCSSGDMRRKPNTVLEAAQKEPIIIMQHTTPRAILVSIEFWNNVSQQLDDLQYVVEKQRENIEGNENE